MRRRFAFVTVCLWSALVAVQPANAARCPSPREAGITPSIQVTPVSPTPRYRYDVSRNQLTAMHSQTNNGSRHGTVLGLTVPGNMGIPATAYQYASVKANGLTCYYVKSFNAPFKLTSIEVYIASEYRQGTCQAQVITTHENEHVRVYQAALQKYAPVMREELARQASTAYTNPGQLQAAMQGAMSSVFQQFLSDARRGNAMIDTQDSYKRTSQRCKQW